MATADTPDDARRRLDALLEDDPADLYENAPCGYLSTTPDGTIVKVNRTMCLWTGRTAEELVGARFPDLLSIGGRIFHETHYAPLLRMQGAVREIAVDVVRVDGSALPCLLNAVELRDQDGEPVLVRATLFDATARRRYETELLAARQAAEQSEGRARTLHQIVSALAAAVTVDEVARVVVERASTVLRAKGVALALLSDATGGEPGFRVARSTGLDDAVLRELEEAARGRMSLELAEGVRAVPLDDRLWARQPGVASVMATAGLTAIVVVPVSADSRYLGILVLGLGPLPGALIDLDGPGESPVASTDLELLTTLGRQAGQALERARLHEQTARQAERAAFLLEAARLMAASYGVDETVDRLADLAVRRLADVCVIDLVTEHGMSRPAGRHRDPARQHLVDELREKHLPGRRMPHPSMQAMREGRTQYVASVDDAWIERVTSSPRHGDVVRELEMVSVISVPLRAGGRALGAITLGSDAQHGPLTPADVEVADQLALQVSQVVDKAQRYEFEARTSHTLQANLLPPQPPSVPGLSVATRYLAASQGVEIGGDFYDVAAMPGGTVAVAVGDVVGHDITAAATMGQLRAVYRALLVERPEPSAVIDRLQASWPFLGLQRMATALFATLDPVSGQLRIASAGHPPPVMVVDGTASLLPVVPTRMLGAPPAPSPAVEWAGVLPPGATVVLYTDGLVESRTADLDVGLAALLAAVSEPFASPDDLCDRLLGSMASGDRDDDVALLALTRAPA
jgi:serine/threonine-protein kinase RsbW